MPAALYPANKQKYFATLTQQFDDAPHITDALLCGECEHRFNVNGEDEVLRWMAPKAKAASTPLMNALRDGTPVFVESDMACYWAGSLGFKPERFAYFALSIVWRGSHEWPMPDGTRSNPIDLGEFAEPVREYLIGDAPYPSHTYVALTVCTDDRSREIWAPPQRSSEWSQLIVFPILGVLFRVWLGRVLPPGIHRTVFFPSDGYPIFTTPCWDVLSQTFAHLFPADERSL